MQDAQWLFFDLGNTLISEEAATECRLQRLVSSLARYGRRCSIDEVRSAFQEASVEFAPRLLSKAIEKLIDDPASQRAVAVEAPYPKELEVPYEGAEELLRTLSSCYKIGVIANQSIGSTDRLTKWRLMPFISTCLCSFDLGLEKPDPAIFELARNYVANTPKRLVFGKRGRAFRSPPPSCPTPMLAPGNPAEPQGSWPSLRGRVAAQPGPDTVGLIERLTAV